ncbi:SUKH-4 family immunity protein [Kitasatospora sp. NPDC056184]|uniref:SUKH-4 family immunity protein n=1 Tax=Kitasatospora sp. NPDC056184 TaxID=3345738 RepID=UPI0035E06325
MGLDEGGRSGGSWTWPAGLTDGPSRTLLASGELSWCYAYLDLRATSAGPPEAAAERFGAGPAGGEGLFVLGEALYSADGEDIAVLLDGASGAVYLACPDESGVLRRDLLASSPHALIALAVVVEAVTLVATGAYEREEGDEVAPYGPATVDAAVRLGLRELREADPDLWQRTDGRPAHWETALRIRALAWGAEPRAADGAPYTVGPDLVEDLADLCGGGIVRRFLPDELPDRLVHTPTRQLLTEVGLPVSCRGPLTVAAEGPLVTLAEAFPDAFADDVDDVDDGDEESTARPYQGDYLALGGWTYDLEAALDGATGRIELPDWHDEDQPAPYLHRDLATLLHVLWAFERLRAERRRSTVLSAPSPWAVFRPRDLLDSVAEPVLRALDPQAWATEDQFWPTRAEDCHMGELIE